MSDDIFDFDIDAELAKAEEKAAQKVKRSLSSSKTKRTAKVARSDRLPHKKPPRRFLCLSVVGCQSSTNPQISNVATRIRQSADTVTSIFPECLFLVPAASR
ncbi:hypothetical protein M5585_20505 [Serratia ureilytica]